MGLFSINGMDVSIRLLESSDNEILFDYFEKLSSESKSRFGPHPFDRETVNQICWNPDHEIYRYIAVDNASGSIVAYMLIKQGMIEWDEKRFADRNEKYDHDTTVTFAPSVSDVWQSKGLGTLMNTVIEDDLRRRGIVKIILWGGVQATNSRAVHFYKKTGYQFLSSFYHNGMDNYDMVKML